MNIYLAARYSRHKELQDYAKVLKSFGHVITSTWIQGGHEVTKEGSTQAAFLQRREFALEDYRDLVRADIVISFTEEPRSTNSRGGRHVEFGLGLGLKRVNIVIGPPENIFHCLSFVYLFESFDDFLKSSVFGEITAP